MLDAVEFADNSPEPPLDSLYDHLYVLGDQVPGWYAVDERRRDPHRGRARGRGATGEARELAEAGAAYGGQAARPPAAGEGEALEDQRGGRRARGPRGVHRRGRRGRAQGAVVSGDADARGAARRDGGGDAPRRVRLRDGRGRRRLPGRLQGHRGAAGRVRREAGARHADLREHDRRHGGRRGDGRACARWSS